MFCCVPLKPFVIATLSVSHFCLVLLHNFSVGCRSHRPLVVSLQGALFTFRFNAVKLVGFFFHYSAAPSTHETATEAEPVFPLGAGLFLSSGVYK